MVGAAGSGGTAGASVIPSCGDIPPDYCVPTWCGGDVVTPPSCTEAGWKCLENWIPESECPDDACFHTPEFCCDALGNGVGAKCPNHGTAVCPDDKYLVTLGPCASAGMFPCGLGLECKLGEEYCQIGPNSEQVCVPMPSACAECGCLTQGVCSTCQDAGIGAFSVYCN
jgi:hypothetical protein